MHHVPTKQAISFAKHLMQAHLNLPADKQIKLEGEGGESLEALFLGTRGGNAEFLLELIKKALAGHVAFRENYFPMDPDYLDAEIMGSQAFKDTQALMGREYEKLISSLQKSGTFFSMRTIGHMLWDTCMPGVLGYFAALLYNQNNVAAEASPVTTLMEMQVGNELCKMLGYAVMPIGSSSAFRLKNDQVTGWGHITCDGSVANLEGLWMARNLKFYPVAVRAAIQEDPVFQNMKDFEVALLDQTKAKIVSLDDWTIMNLPIDEILSIPDNICKQYGLDMQTVSDAISNYSVQNMGLYTLMSKYVSSLGQAPVSMCSATRHYSWPKNAAILGIGDNNMWNIPVDLHARMNLTDLRASLDKCLKEKIPVMNVVAIIGTTEESAVDPLTEILLLKKEFEAQGMEFAIHCDAAWGGYFKSMLNDDEQDDPVLYKQLEKDDIIALPMSEYVTKQYQVLQYADSITIDPHKSGYIPYPAGGLCYRNSAMRNLVSFTAPVVYHAGVDPTVGVYGVEGSKPGAAAAAVFFSHKVIRPTKSGYGKLSGECFFNAKRLYAALVCLNINKLPFFIVPLVPIPAIQEKKSPAEVQAQYEFIRDRIVNVTNNQLLEDEEAFALFKELGGDQTIVSYIFNFYNEDRTPNADMGKVNKLNNAIYTRFSYKPYEANTEDTPIVVTSSSYTRKVDGNLLIDNLRLRLGVNTEPNADINFIISTVMNPWLSNTVKGSFIPKIVEIMTDSINKQIADIVKETV